MSSAQLCDLLFRKENLYTNNYQCFVVFIICVFGAFVYWSYCAMLVSYLTVTDNELPINTLDDILRNKGYCIILGNGSVTNDYFFEADLDTNPVAYNILQQGRVIVIILKNTCIRILKLYCEVKT